MAKHTIVFTGTVPDDEAERAGVHSPEVRAATQALRDALEATGHPHEMKRKIVKTKAPGAAPRRRGASSAPRAAAE